ncbi:MAG: RagB/SusD family nutrient uptake outer membrane protein, partial [Flavobacteriaceae bacterium]|nr:RagB/SusD family nutrient uptake outer membrane protein [Flavobacteriaceae bacterium]
MKKIIYLLLLLLVVSACSESFTDSTAYGALSDENLQNAQGIDLKLIGAYSLLDGMSNTGSSDWSKTGDNWWFDVISDDAHKGSTDGDQADLFLLEIFDWTSTNPYTTGRWRALYAGTNRANAVIDLIGQITDEDFTQQMAEARFLRGYYNFQLQRIWGNVAYISEENYANTEFNQPNTGPIWDQIEADFDFAMKNLKDEASEVGRPTSWTATAFLGKVHLYQHEFTDALGLLETVINSGPYSLLPEFVDNFRMAGDNSVESIFAIQFAADDGQSYNGNRGGTLNFPGGGPINSCCGFYQGTQDLVNAYQTSAGLPLLDTYNQTDVANDYGLNSYLPKDEPEDPDVPTPFDPHTGPLDPRLDYTVGRRAIDFNGWGVNVGKDWIRASFADISGPYLAKKSMYYAGEDANMGTGGWGEQRSGINYHIMRYADVLLMAAECAAEGGDTDKALGYV